MYRDPSFKDKQEDSSGRRGKMNRHPDASCRGILQRKDQAIVYRDPSFKDKQEDSSGRRGKMGRHPDVSHEDIL